MLKSHIVATCLALGTVAALPGCSDYHSHPTPVAATQPEVSPGMVRHVQSVLQAQGYYKGSLDGLWGPETQGALRTYQQAHGLMPSGELTSPTLASLFPPGPTSLATPPAATTTATSAPTQ